MKLVFVHGWGFDARVWDAVIACLPGANIVSFDLGYFGERQWPVVEGPSLAITHSFGTMALLAEPLSAQEAYDAGLGTHVAGDEEFPALVETLVRRLASGLRSGAEAAGPIPWPTWPEEKAIPAFTAIDHIFSRGATPLEWSTVAIAGSDHRAVITGWGLCAAQSIGVFLGSDDAD